MVVPSPIYHTDRRETVTALRAVAQATDLPIMIYSNRLAYRVDVTPDVMEELASDTRFVAIKESSDDIRRTTEIFNRLGHRYLVQNIKLAEAVANHSNDRVRPPRLAHAGEARVRIERIVRDAIASRPALPKAA